MPNNYVEKFTLDGSEILVRDTEAQGNISTINSEISGLDGRIDDLEALSRLTVSYNGTTSTIAFSTQTHANTP